ncbi:plasma membrane localization protein [Dispira parvispora]|uniref:Plasma membrane localization protein n=1 Tax=Dispira parvispora TaxID=1520584 RepID=A0A9W8E0W4_9FUNG|nr:plasma membrane localization protein [Dispira parvispora]
MGKSISHTGVGTRDTPGQAMESQGGKSATLTSNPLMVTPRKPSNSTLNSDQPTSPGDSTPLLLGGNASMCSSSTSQVRIGDIIAELVSAIGGLGSHTYYGEQIADIISHIMEELHIPDDSWGEESVASGSSVYRERLGSTNLGGLEVTSPRQIGKLRIVLLRALSGMLRASLRSRFRAPNMIVSNVSLGLITPTTFLFGDADPSVRLHYAQFIINFLYHQNIEYFRSLGIFTTVTAQELTTESSTGQGQSSRGSDLADHTVGTCSMDMLPVSASSLALSSMKYQPSVSQNIVHSRRTLLIDIETRSLLHRALFQYATQTSNTTNDVIGIGVILILLLQRYTHEEFVLVTPVLLKIQNFAKELLTKLGVALHTMVVMYLSTVARLFELPSLSTYLDELVGQRKVRALWDKHVEHCLQLERLESVHYHLFELSLGDSETCAIRTIPSRSGELPGKLAEVTDPNQPGSEDMSAIHGEYDDSTLLSAARLLECFGTNKQLLREYPDLPSRLAGEYPIVELRTLVKPRIARKMASRSQIRASLNLEPFKNTTVRPFKESSALSPPLNGVSQPTEPSFQPTLMTCSMLNGLADRKSLPSSPGLPRTNSSQGLAKIPKETAEVRVENLREALYVQIPPDSSEPDTDSETHHYTNPRSSYRGGEHIRSNSPFPGHSPRRNTGKPRPNEVQNLLQSISASSPHLSFQGGLLSNTPDFRHPF